MNPIRLCIVGATGRFGSTMVKEISSDFELVGAVASSDNKNAGKSLRSIGLRDSDIILHNSPSMADAVKDADVVISVTNPVAELENAPKIAKAGKKIIIGTTGFTPEQSSKLKAYIANVPALIASNFSIGMNFVFNIASMISSLPPEYDTSIVEVHHIAKADSPSGTALTLGDIVSKARGYSKTIFDRRAAGKRGKEELEILAQRLGGVPGIHEINIAGSYEMIRIEHIAFSRSVFAQGALVAAKWLHDIKKPGIYNMQDVLKPK
jgi:4-hydroxy-tetrahydrodipicolinate reductase